jgi:hypothetical protein
MPTRRNFIKTTALLALTPVLPRLAVHGANTSLAANPLPSLKEQLGLSRPYQKWLACLQAEKLLDINPIVSAPEGDVNHLGFPVAVRLSDGRIVMVFQRARSGHITAGVWHGAGLPAGRYAITTDDGGQTWRPSDMFDLCARLSDPDGMHCVGVARRKDGGERVVVVASGAPREVYLSDDRGETWRTNTNAFKDLLDGAVHCGPRLITHPEFGIVAAFGQQKKASTRRNWLARSLDAGETWEQCIWQNPMPSRGVEPSLVTWGAGHMVMIAREYVPEFAINEDGYYCHTQLVYKHEPGARFSNVKFNAARTNIAGNPAFGQDCHDTAEVIYTPVTRRIECIQSHRRGGGEGRTGKVFEKNRKDRINTLNLWSIDPDELLAGATRWRFECTLVEREDYSRNSDRDGMHPGGSIVDEERGVQHIFIYAGWRRRPCSIFHVTRALDTPALVRAWKQSSIV